MQTVSRVQINGNKFDWSPISSSVSEGSVLVLLLFIINICDLDSIMMSDINRFADDTKIGGRIRPMTFEYYRGS